MRILKTTAITLRVLPHANTSQIVIWLTDAGDRLATMIKGACRPKSAFQGQYDLFCVSELLYYHREHDGLHIARECALLEPKGGLRRDWRSFAGASYISQLVMSSSLEGTRDPESYRLLRQALRALDLGAAQQETVFWFELQWLRHFGFAPQLRHCTRCRTVLPDGAPQVCWSPEGVVCAGCATSTTPLPTVPPDVLAILRRWQEQSDERRTTLLCTDRQCLEFDRLLGMMLVWHLETRPESRRIALQLMRARTGAEGILT